MSDRTQRFAQMSLEQRKLLEKRLLRRASAAEERPQIPRRRGFSPPALSFAQQRLWFLDQLEPGSNAYNVPVALRLSGALNVSALTWALNEIVRRHEILRTSLPVMDEEPVQQIAPHEAFDVPLLDLSARAGTNRFPDARTLATDEARKPFDLANGPLVRFSLLRLSDAEHLLLVTFHHSVSDGWSLGVFSREFAEFYNAKTEGREPRLDELPVQYADYAVWQREWLSGRELERQLAYWREQLAGAPGALELPTDQPRSAARTFNGRKYRTAISGQLRDRAKALGQARGCTLFMVLLAAFQVLLSRYTGEEEIVIGTPIAGRNYKELEGLIGFFVNTLVLRTDVSGEPSFEELLERVRATALDGYAHQDVPFERLVEELKLERDLSHSPLFQVMFILQNAPKVKLEMSGLRLQGEPIDIGNSMFDLTLYANEAEDKLVLLFEYNADLFDAQTIERMAGHYERLLEGMLSNPGCPVSRCPLLGDEEHEQLLVGWNNTATSYPRDMSVHALFEAQVERTPQSMAVEYDGEALTYEALNRRANVLAHHLIGLGVKPEVLVGLCVERSLGMVVGLLGILKAGGAYVPLDPSYPPARLAYMLEDSGARVLVTQEALQETLPEYGGARVLLDGLDWEAVEGTERNPSMSDGAENLAYAIYTSGSTGKPKGVLAPHKGAVNRFAWMWERYPFAEDEVCCQKTALSFVDSVWELFGPLLQGIKVVIVSDEHVADTDKLVAELSHAKVTRIVLVPSLLHALLDTVPDLAERLPKLNMWVVSGELLSAELCSRFHERMPGTTLLNLYGSSEVAADVTYYETGDREAGRSVPIGRPIANSQVYVLDEHGQVVPVGVQGEICVGGDGLARGYLNRPDEQSERFFSYDLAPERTTRLFRTGDMGRWRADGNLLYLGRRDHQVKVRGHRIELGEIEASLVRHPEVSDAVVTVLGVGGDDAQLVAYYQSGAMSPPDIGDLRQYVGKVLPAYMVPSFFVPLDAFPLTPSGKVDRLSLPEPQTLGSDDTRRVEPRTPIEESVAAIWSELLGVSECCVHDNFFEVGGHSLSATRMVSHLRQEFGVDLPLLTIFEHPTIAGLSDELVSLQLEDIAEDDLESLLSDIEEPGKQ